MQILFIILKLKKIRYILNDDRIKHNMTYKYLNYNINLSAQV